MKLCVFDFDNTLFRSPSPPKKWKDGWWTKPISLNPPFVPKEPDMYWWNDSIIEEILMCSGKKDNYVILLTGRLDNVFRERVMELLNQIGITKKFDYVGLNNQKNTIKYKLDTMSEFLKKDPRIREVEIWDDRVEHAQAFEDWARKNRLVYTHNLITSMQKEPEEIP